MEANIINLEKKFKLQADDLILENPSHSIVSINTVIHANNQSIINIISRRYWENGFKSMNRKKDDSILIDDILDLDMEDWEWK
jgi:hypothetical protein